MHMEAGEYQNIKIMSVYSTLNTHLQVNGPLQCKGLRWAAEVFVPKLSDSSARPARGRTTRGANRHHDRVIDKR